MKHCLSNSTLVQDLSEVPVFEEETTLRRSKRRRCAPAERREIEDAQANENAPTSTPARRSRPPKKNNATAASPRKRIVAIPIVQDPRATDTEEADDNVCLDGAHLPLKPPVKRKKPVKVIQPKHDPSAAPPNWEAVYNAIKVMRAKIEAPVDTKGCDMAQLLETDPRNKRFITLVSLILSVRTTDNICDATVKNLRQAVGGTMSLEKFLATDEDTIQEVLKSVGLNKADNLINTAHILREDFNSDVPDTIQDLVKLWGVGPKVGFLTLSVAWGKHDGIGVDVHVRRITQRLGWHNEEDPEKARQKLQVWFPKERFQELNKLLVGLGQTICGEPPKCHLCALSSGICPKVSVKSKNTPKTKSSKGAGKSKAKYATIYESDDELTDLEDDD